MPRIRPMNVYLGAAVTVTGAYAATPPNLQLVEKVSAQRFEVAWRVDDGGQPVESIQLWYTIDQGRTWRNYGTTLNPQPPIIFTATEQGLYGFFLIAANSVGLSADAPGPATEPQHWAFVDYTPPVVQLHPVIPNDPPTVPQTVRLRWSAIDNALRARPVVLSYRTIPDGSWQTIDGPMANTGSYDWRVDENVTGKAVVRISVRDHGEHLVEVSSDPFELRPHQSLVPEPSDNQRPLHESGLPLVGGADDDQSSHNGTRAQALYRKGVLHALRGEYRLAASRLGDALAIDADLTEALVELGGVLYAQGQLTEAIEAYQLALRQEPQLRGALEGLALTYIGERRFPEAVQHLSRIVRANPKDVDAWLNLGDIAIYQGDELLAREHYRKAATLNPAASDTIAKAKLRLAELKRLAADFRQVDLPR